jgi:opacity protein-like surface antigen
MTQELLIPMNTHRISTASVMRGRAVVSLLFLVLFMSFTKGALGADTGFYVAAGAGKSWQHVDRTQGILFVTTPGAPAEFLRAISIDVDETNVAWNAALGYRMNRYLAAEVSYLHYGSAGVTETFALPLGNLPVPPINGIGGATIIFNHRYSSQIEGPALSILGRLPIGRQFAVFARGGIFFADEKVTQENDIGSDSITLGKQVWLASAGAEWSFTPSWALRLEYAQSGHLNGNPIAGRTDVRHLALNALYSW